MGAMYCISVRYVDEVLTGERRTRIRQLDRGDIESLRLRNEQTSTLQRLDARAHKKQVEVEINNK